MTQYTVQRGDSLSLIARRFHIANWQTIYNHPQNADFRRRRPNPNLIYPGDVVFLPDGRITPPPGPAPAPRRLDYTVPGMIDVIAQPTSLVCWATVYTMMRSWKFQTSTPIRTAVAEVDERYGIRVDNNQALPPNEFLPFLRAANMRYEPMANYTIEAWANNLRSYGMLWVGTMNLDSSGRHSRIIRAISGDGGVETTFFSIIDPDGARQYREKFSDFLRRYEDAFTYSDNTGYYQVRHW
jgi:papain like cysteine protease AvrRpt2/LysM domain-containing protein